MRPFAIALSSIVLLSAAARAEDAPTFTREEVQVIVQIAVQQDRLNMLTQQPTAKIALSKMQPAVPPPGAKPASEEK